MPRKPRLWQFRIRDILGAIERIEDYTEGMSFEEFAADRKTLDAVERNFIAIGEAARGVPVEVQRRRPEIPWADMNAMRNFVVHIYWGVDARRVWDTIHANLLPLVPMLQQLLEAEETEGE